MRQVQATVKLGVIINHAIWISPDHAKGMTPEQVQKLKAELWEVFMELTGTDSKDFIEALFEKAMGKTTPLPAVNKKEEHTMLSKHVITEVTVGEINPITLEMAIKKLSAANSKFQLVEKGEVTYLVVEGADPIELKGDAFKDLITNALVGKTLENIRSNSQLSQLVQGLNVLESITLSKPKAKLEDLFK
jgi:hypothetical protein